MMNREILGFSKVALQTTTNKQFGTPTVAPRAGAWIETILLQSLTELAVASPLVQGRGLKHELA